MFIHFTLMRTTFHTHLILHNFITIFNTRHKLWISPLFLNFLKLLVTVFCYIKIFFSESCSLTLLNCDDNSLLGSGAVHTLSLSSQPWTLQISVSPFWFITVYGLVCGYQRFPPKRYPITSSNTVITQRTINKIFTDVRTSDVSLNSLRISVNSLIITHVKIIT